jgi:hypothetical protein
VVPARPRLSPFPRSTASRRAVSVSACPVTARAVVEIVSLCLRLIRFPDLLHSTARSWRALSYVDQNPVRTGLVSSAAEYPWSSAAPHLSGDDPSGLLDLKWWRDEGMGPTWHERLASVDHDCDWRSARTQGDRSGTLTSWPWPANALAAVGRPAVPERNGWRRTRPAYWLQHRQGFSPAEKPARIRLSLASPGFPPGYPTCGPRSLGHIDSVQAVVAERPNVFPVQGEHLLKLPFPWRYRRGQSHVRFACCRDFRQRLAGLGLVARPRTVSAGISARLQALGCTISTAQEPARRCSMAPWRPYGEYFMVGVS